MIAVPDEDLVEAVEQIPDADPDTISQHDDGHGYFIINANLNDLEDDDLEAIDGPLLEAGYELDGVLAPPGMVQQNFTPTGGDDE